MGFLDPVSVVVIVNAVMMAMHTHKKSCLEVTKDKKMAMHWVMQRGLLRKNVDCSKCGLASRLVGRKGSFSWRCSCKGCQAVQSARDSSFYAGSHLMGDEILELTYWWSRGVKVSIAMAEMGHLSKTMNLYNFHATTARSTLLTT